MTHDNRIIRTTVMVIEPVDTVEKTTQISREIMKAFEIAKVKGSLSSSVSVGTHDGHVVTTRHTVSLDTGNIRRPILKAYKAAMLGSWEPTAPAIRVLIESGDGQLLLKVDHVPASVYTKWNFKEAIEFARRGTTE